MLDLDIENHLHECLSGPCCAEALSHSASDISDGVLRLHLPKHASPTESA